MRALHAVVIGLVSATYCPQTLAVQPNIPDRKAWYNQEPPQAPGKLKYNPSLKLQEPAGQGPQPNSPGPTPVGATNPSAPPQGWTGTGEQWNQYQAAGGSPQTFANQPKNRQSPGAAIADQEYAQRNATFGGTSGGPTPNMAYVNRQGAAGGNAGGPTPYGKELKESEGRIGSIENQMAKNEEEIKSIDETMCKNGMCSAADGKRLKDLRDENAKLGSDLETAKSDQTRLQANSNYESGFKGTSQGLSKNEEWDREGQVTSKDKCRYGATINGKFECDSTYNAIDMGNMADMMGQAAGSAVTQAAGQQAAIKAQTSGSQADAMEGAATSAKTAGMAQGAKGMLNMVMGMLHWKNKGDHEDNEKEIDKGTQGMKFGGEAGQQGDGIATMEGTATLENGDTVATGVYEKFTLNEKVALGSNCDPAMQATAPAAYAQCIQNRRAEFERKKAIMAKEGRFIGDSAEGEQAQAAKAAKMAGMMSMMKGTADLVQSAGQMMAAAEYQKAANKLRGAEGNGIAFQAPNLNFGPQGPVAMNPGGGGVGFAPGRNQDAAKAEELLKDTPVTGNLGTPTGLNDGKVGQGPAPGAFVAGGPGGGSGGGGGGIGSAGSTGNSQGDSGPEPQAQAATDGSNMGYASGNYSRSGGGGGGGKGLDSGPDMAAMLAALGGKKEEGGPGNGILDYGRGGRGLASEEGISGRNADLFKQVSNRYQIKVQQGMN